MKLRLSGEELRVLESIRKSRRLIEESREAVRESRQLLDVLAARRSQLAASTAEESFEDWARQVAALVALKGATSESQTRVEWAGPAELG